MLQKRCSFASPNCLTGSRPCCNYEGIGLSFAQISLQHFPRTSSWLQPSPNRRYGMSPIQMIVIGAGVMALAGSPVVLSHAQTTSGSSQTSPSPSGKSGSSSSQSGHQGSSPGQSGTGSGASPGMGSGSGMGSAGSGSSGSQHGGSAGSGGRGGGGGMGGSR
jgi:hypothetical protein